VYVCVHVFSHFHLVKETDSHYHGMNVMTLWRSSHLPVFSVSWYGTDKIIP